jgi:hypothetical protein
LPRLRSSVLGLLGGADPLVKHDPPDFRVILVWLGVRAMLRARAVARRPRALTSRAAYASTLMLSLTNLRTVVPYLALATVAAEGNTAIPAFSLWSVPGVIMAAAA